MALRLMEVFLSGSGGELLRDVLNQHPIEDQWITESSETHTTMNLLVRAEHAEAIMDALQSQFGVGEGLRVVLLSVEATVPRFRRKAERNGSTAMESDAKIAGSRISREELYADIEDTVSVSSVFSTFVLLSTVVAAVGLLKNNVAIIIGAMVIAPFLGPNVAMALATTLGDRDLAGRAVKANALGLLLALIVSVLVGSWLPVDPALSELAGRTSVDLFDVVLALAAGSAGALAFTTGVASSLIGVMVAVALLPPLVTAGLLLGAGHIRLALGALLLLGANVICVNLAGVVTFLFQAVRPHTWWEADKARRSTRLAIALWGVLLLTLVGLITMSRAL